MKHRYDSTCWQPALKDGASVKLVLEIDRMDILDWLGSKALQSKHGKSQALSGAVRVRVERRQS